MLDESPSVGASNDIYASRRAAANGFFIVFAAAWLVDFSGLGIVMQITFHEFGHAAAAWLGGRWAIPIPIAALTFWGDERSAFVALLLAAGLGWLWKRAWDEDRLWLLGLSTAMLGVMIYFALIPDAEVEMWGIFAGVAGEMILSSLLVCAFFWDVSKRLRWDFWRYPVLLAASCAWLQSASLWAGANIGLAGWSLRPQDEAVAHDPRAYVEWLANTPGGNDQDCYRLVHKYGWTVRGIADGYRGIAAATLAAIALAGAGAVRGGRRPPGAA